jgi:hypothetical protein
MSRANIGLCLILFGAFHSGALAAPYFSRQCAECKKNCAETRLRIKSFCCTHNGGIQRDPYSCSDVKNESQYILCLKGGERDEISCSDDCNVNLECNAR